MNASFHMARTALLAGAATAAMSAPSNAAVQSACDVLPASAVSAIVGRPVTAHGHPSNVTPGGSVCLYAAGRPFFQLGISVMENEAVAKRNVSLEQQAGSAHRNVRSRQKGNLVLSGITMSGDAGKMDALLDAAVKNLAR